MNRTLQIQIPMISAKYTFCQYNAEKYKSIDAKIKERQRMNFDKCHQDKEHSSFVEEQPVWVNTTKTTQAKVVKSLSPRSVLVKTDSELLQRNKRHLHRRNDQTKFSQVVTPQEVSTLPNLLREVPEYSHDDSNMRILLNKLTNQKLSTLHRVSVQCAEFLVSANTESSHIARYTRRG